MMLEWNEQAQKWRGQKLKCSAVTTLSLQLRWKEFVPLYLSFCYCKGVNTFEFKCMYVVRPVATLEFQTCFSTQHKDLWRVNGIIPSYAIWPEHVTYTGQILA